MLNFRASIFLNKRKIIKICLVGVIFFIVHSEPILIKKAMGEENLSNNNSQKPSLIDQLAPNFLLTTLNGETFNLSEVIKNRRAMIYFWATWCPNCLKKLQYFSESAEMFEQQNIALVIINYGEEKERVVEYINQYNIDLNIVLDQEKSLQKSYDLNSLPTLIFINSEGLIKNIKHDLDLHNL